MNWRQLNKKQRQNVIRLGAMALLGILLLLYGGKTDVPSSKMDSSEEVQTTISSMENSSDKRISALERQLQETLSKVQGAGVVTVQIMVKDFGRKEYAQDMQKTERVTEEESNERKQRTTETQENRSMVQGTMGQREQALLLQETMPEVQGILIVASGAKEACVQEQLLQAAAVLLQLSAEQIIVLPGEEETTHA